MAKSLKLATLSAVVATLGTLTYGTPTHAASRRKEAISVSKSKAGSPSNAMHFTCSDSDKASLKRAEEKRTRKIEQRKALEKIHAQRKTQHS